jgi:hypothetical protein
MKRTNYFGRFENKSADAEDRLTRAFLVVLRLIPPVQAAFIDAIREKQHEQGNGPVVPSRTETDTGFAGVWSQVGNLRTDEGRVLSILLTNREWDGEVEVQPSDRTPVYDGVVHYAEQWVFAIENKPYGDVRESQLHPNVGDAEGLEVDPGLVVLVWKDLIRRLHALGESDWLDYTQHQLVNDFLRHAQDEFPEINPYPTLKHCGDDVDKLNRRCEDLMEEIAPGRVETHKGWRNYILAPELDAAKMVSVSAQRSDQSWEIDLVIHPGDTVSQASTFYSDLNVDALLALSEEWDCSTNLHFSHISSNLVYPTSEVSFEEYIEFWQEHQEWIRQVKEDQFEELLDLLESNGLLTETDREKFEAEFFETNRSTANVCPGISLHYRWDRTEAHDLDENDRLTEEINERVREAVRMWGAEAAWDDVISTADSGTQVSL